LLTGPRLGYKSPVKLTTYTPTHNPKHLARLADSIRRQTYPNFEWLIVPNGPVTPGDIHVDMPKARIVPYNGQTANVGEIKNFCCAQAAGDVLVEVDHDDEITPDCLEEAAKAFQEPCDFVYSNFCEVQADGQPYLYDLAYGWQYRDWPWQGKTQKECVGWAPSPASFCKVWYAPNHVRAWRRSFYERIGGHNKTLRVLDDHDLSCRTYIHGEVKHIDRCLYVYHRHEGNTCLNTDDGTNQSIQEKTLEIHDEYIYPMVEKWCRKNGLLMVDICGGHSKPPGYLSVDLHDSDIVANLEEKWPFGNNTVGLFRAQDALEHMKNPIHTMKEIYRCLIPGGWLLSETPSTDGRGAFQDPTHISFWNSNSFWYYTRREQAAYIGTPVRFQASRIANYYPSPWHKDHQIVYVKAHLIKIGSDRLPGLVEI